MADTMLYRTVPFRAGGRDHLVDTPRELVADGTYRVLATLRAGERSYRVLGDLVVDEGDAELRFYRFQVATADEWFAERKMSVSVRRAELARCEYQVSGADYVLHPHVHLSEENTAAVFGSSGLPET